jgi:hypothetical protein
MNNKSTTYHYACIKSIGLKGPNVKVKVYFLFVHFGSEFSHLNEGVA